MRTQPVSTKSRRPGPDTNELFQKMSDRVIGQPHALAQIVAYVHMYQAGLAPEGRPAGVFLLLGPTGTGKTRTVEALADALHGSPKQMLKVDCGEFQMEHEVAKLIGAPPGYLGHRETQPLLTQQKLGAVTSENSSLALVLFDEIEKAAQSLTRLLLGVLDKAILRLGDNTSVNFERALIFLTSNLGGRAMSRELRPDFGFEAVLTPSQRPVGGKLNRIGMNAVRRKFSPEFVNRIDGVITYLPLGAGSLEIILDQQIAELERHIEDRLMDRAFELEVTPAARRFLLDKGTSDEHGARELKRTIVRQITQPLAAMVTERGIDPGEVVRIEPSDDGEGLSLIVE